MKTKEYKAYMLIIMTLRGGLQKQWNLINTI